MISATPVNFTTRRTQQLKSRQAGLSLIEQVIVIAIAGIVLAAAVIYGQRLFADQKVSDEAQRISLMAAKIRSYYATSQAITAAPTGADLVKMGAVTGDAFDGTNVTAKMTGVSYRFSVGNLLSNGDSLIISIGPLTETDCVSLTKSVNNIAAGITRTAAPLAALAPNASPAAGSIKVLNGAIDDTLLLSGCAVGAVNQVNFWIAKG